jgi:hypothetical protein
VRSEAQPYSKPSSTLTNSDERAQQANNCQKIYYTIYPFSNKNTSVFFREQRLNKQAVRQTAYHQRIWEIFQGTKMRKKWKKKNQLEIWALHTVE